MSKVRLTGSNSGYVEIAAAADAGNLTFTMPTSGTALLGNTGNVFSGITTTGQLDINGSIDVSSTSVFNDDVTLTGGSYNVVWDKSDNQLEFGDNAKLSFGASSDLQLYHDGSNSFISDAGTGGIKILGSAVYIKNVNDHDMVEALSGGAVSLFHNNSKKFQTTNTGAVVTGICTATSFSGSGEGLTRTTQLSHRNKVINGAMQVAQRGTSVSIGSDSSTYLIDRFKLGRYNAGDWIMSQSTESPDGFSSSLKIDSTSVTTGLGVNREVGIYQVFEGQDLQDFAKGTSSAKEFTLSFYIKCNKNGTYNVELMDNDNSNRHVSKTYTVSNNNWTRHIITFPADTTGAFNNDNGNSMHVYFWLASGGQFRTGSRQETWGALNQGGRAPGQANLMDSTSNEWYITGVQLEVGSVATPFEHRSFGDELLRCYRYYNKKNPAYGRIGHMYTNTAIAFTMDLPCEMRASPTITNEGGLYFARQNGLALGLTGINHGSTVTTTARISLDVNSNGDDGESAFIWSNSTYYILDAEL